MRVGRHGLLCILCQLVGYTALGCSTADDLTDAWSGGDGDSETYADGDGDSDGDSDSDGDDADVSTEGAHFEVDITTSRAISTVGIVEWSIDHTPIDAAHIDFGLDDGYGMTAPVDLGARNNRTLLLGMKPSSIYHLRVVAFDGEARFESEDRTIETGPVTNLIGAPRVEDLRPDEVAGGFIVSSTFNMTFIGTPIVFILDPDGDVVWWYESSLQDTTRARMSYDGTHIAMIPANNIGNMGDIEMVSMDGLESAVFDIPGASHDLVPTPDGTIAYIDASGGGMTEGVCGRIYEFDYDLSNTDIFFTSLVYDSTDFWVDGCHANALRYSEAEDVFTVSDLNHSQIIAVDRAGELQWVANVGGRLWTSQHGHHLLDESLLLYSNENDLVLEYQFDDSFNGMSEIWRYNGGRSTLTLGDVQRLPNGNTLVTYSNDGVFHEVSPSGALVRTISFRQAAPSYSVWRSSLYGPPDDITL